MGYLIWNRVLVLTCFTNINSSYIPSDNIMDLPEKQSVMTSSARFETTLSWELREAQINNELTFINDTNCISDLVTKLNTWCTSKINSFKKEMLRQMSFGIRRNRSNEHLCGFLKQSRKIVISFVRKHKTSETNIKDLNRLHSSPGPKFEP